MGSQIQDVNIDIKKSTESNLSCLWQEPNFQVIITIIKKFCYQLRQTCYTLAGRDDCHGSWQLLSVMKNQFHKVQTRLEEFESSFSAGRKEKRNAFVLLLSFPLRNIINKIILAGPS